MNSFTKKWVKYDPVCSIAPDTYILLFGYYWIGISICPHGFVNGLLFLNWKMKNYASISLAAHRDNSGDHIPKSSTAPLMDK